MSGGDAFTLFQAHVATRLGVSEERVRELRGQLQQGRDWVKRGNRVLYAEGCVEKLAGALGTSAPPAAEKGPRLLEWAPKGPVRIVVARLPMNPLWVLGVWPDADQGAEPAGGWLRVKVRNSRELRPGMVMECFFEGGDVYRCPKLPRKGAGL